MADEFLKLQNISHRFDGEEVLTGIDWAVDRGENWAIIGPNGAGKTTLVRIACGYLWPNRGGEVIRQGELRPNMRELWKSIGWISAELREKFPANQKTLTTIITGRYATTRSIFREQESDRQAALEILANFDASGLAEKKFSQLSQGEKQIVLVARAMMAEPYLLVLDEPCAGLDPGQRENFLAFLDRAEKSRQEVGIILITHHVEEIIPIFSRVLALEDGEVVARGKKEEILNQKVLSELYDSPISPRRIEDRYWPVVES